MSRSACAGDVHPCQRWAALQSGRRPPAAALQPCCSVSNAACRPSPVSPAGFRLYRETPLPPLEPAKEGAADQEEASKPAVKQEAAAKPAAEQKAPLASIKQEAPASQRPAAAAPAGPVVAAALQHGGLVPGQAPLQVAQLQAMMQAAAAAQQLPFLQAAAAAQQLPFLQMAAAQQLPFLQAAAAARLSAQQQPAAADSGSDEDESWWEEQARLAAYQVPPDPEQQPRWEVAATTLEEFEVRGQRGVRREWKGMLGQDMCCCWLGKPCWFTAMPAVPCAAASSLPPLPYLFGCAMPLPAGSDQQVCGQQPPRGARHGPEAAGAGEEYKGSWRCSACWANAHYGHSLHQLCSGWPETPTHCQQLSTDRVHPPPSTHYAGAGPPAGHAAGGGAAHQGAGGGAEEAGHADADGGPCSVGSTGRHRQRRRRRGCRRRCCRPGCCRRCYRQRQCRGGI